jgi:hypothetical protein
MMLVRNNLSIDNDDDGGLDDNVPLNDFSSPIKDDEDAKILVDNRVLRHLRERERWKKKS